MPEFPSFDGCRIAFSDAGEGRPVVLLHGFIVDSTLNWTPELIEGLLHRGYRVIVPDARGHGMSGKPQQPADYTDDALVKDVVMLLDHVAADGVALIGYSMGADTAIRVAARDARVEALIAGGVGGDLSDPADLDRAEVAQQIRSADDGEAVGSPVAELVSAFGGDAAALAALFEGLGRQISPQFSSITCPCLVIRGDSDNMSGGTAEALAKLLPNGESLTLAGLDHLGAVFDPQFSEGMMTFLRSAYPAN